MKASRLRVPGLERFPRSRAGFTMNDLQRLQIEWCVRLPDGTQRNVIAHDAEAAAARAWVTGSRFGKLGAVLGVARYLKHEPGFAYLDVEEPVTAAGASFLAAARAASVLGAAWRRRLVSHRRVHVYDLEQHEWTRGPVACGRRDRIRFADGTIETVRRGGR